MSIVASDDDDSGTVSPIATHTHPSIAPIWSDWRQVSSTVNSTTTVRAAVHSAGIQLSEAHSSQSLPTARPATRSPDRPVDQEYWTMPIDVPDRDEPYWPFDRSAPCPDAREIIDARKEFGSMDEPWKSRTFTALDDPIYQPLGEGVINFTINAYNGTKKRPNMQTKMHSGSVWIGGHLWRIKLMPKGTTAVPYPKVYIENMSIKRAARQEWPEDELLLPVLGPFKRLPMSPQVAAQFSVVAYNPSDPRVFVFKNDSYQFSQDSHDRGWECFTERRWYELHTREYYQPEPLLHHDQLVLKAFIRVIKDPTRSLWLRVADVPCKTLVDRTGHLPLPPAGSISAVITLLLYLKPFRTILYRLASILQARSSPSSPDTLLLRCLVQLLYNMRRRVDEGNARLLAFMRQILNDHGTADFNYSKHESSSSVRVDASQILQGLKKCLDASTSLLLGNQHRSTGEQCLTTDHHDLFAQLHPTKIDVDSDTDLQALLGSRDDIEPASSWKLFELKRQVYDRSKRCWIKRCTRVTMNATLNLAGTRYTLHGVITHKAHLNSGLYQAYVRSTGPAEMWLTGTGNNTMFVAPSAVTSNMAGSGESYVSPPPKNDVKMGSHIGASKNAQPEEVAYILCYRKCALEHDTAPASPSEETWDVPEWVNSSRTSTPQGTSSVSTRRTLVKPGVSGSAATGNAVPSAHTTVTADGRDTAMAVDLNLDTHEPPGMDVDMSDGNEGSEDDDDSMKGVNDVVTDNVAIVDSGDTVVTMARESTGAMEEPKDLTMKDCPTTIAPKEVNTDLVKIDFLSQPWYEGGMRSGKYHGQGHLITLSGDEYIGEFLDGMYDGRGKLATADGYKYEGKFAKGLYEGWGELHRVDEQGKIGDKYHGDFVKGRYHGSGLLVDGETGNIYDGGWKRGKKHGRGTTYWKSSEEQKRLCKICEGRTADHVFYDCGHVVACKSCARECEECPVCRKEVRDVIKIFVA